MWEEHAPLSLTGFMHVSMEEPFSSAWRIPIMLAILKRLVR
jgi:hypothetical protein